MNKMLTAMINVNSASTNIITETIESLLASINARDAYTHQHSLNVAIYSWQIAKQLQFDEEESSNIYIGALLHDIGKIGTPDSVLLKTGKLNHEETEIRLI